MSHKTLYLLLIPILFLTCIPKAKAQKVEQLKASATTYRPSFAPRSSTNASQEPNNSFQSKFSQKQIQPRTTKPVYYSMANRLHFYSQKYPKNTSCCESASLLMALSIKGHAHNMSLEKFTRKKVGWFTHGNKAKEVNYRYDRDPYQQPSTIYPQGLKRAAARMGAKSKVIDHASKRRIIYYLTHGDPIAAEASYHLEIWVANHSRQSDHIICLIGYHRSRRGHEYIQYADPYYKFRSQGVRWGTMKQFLRSYRRPITGERALVVLK